MAALAGLWMTQFYPLPATDGALLYGFRLVFGTAMIASIAMGFVAIRRREVARHRAWMMRGYAIGLGAGTQAFVLLTAQLVAGTPSVDVRALLMGASWALNLAIAEWFIRGRPLLIGPAPRRSWLVVNLRLLQGMDEHSTRSGGRVDQHQVRGQAIGSQGDEHNVPAVRLPSQSVGSTHARRP